MPPLRRRQRLKSLPNVGADLRVCPLMGVPTHSPLKANCHIKFLTCLKNQMRVLAFLLLLAACVPTMTPSPTPTNPTDAILVAQVPQSEPPAIYVDEGRITAAWIDEDQVGVHQAARVIGEGEVIVLPLPPQQPRAQSLHASTGERTRLLWLDTEDGETRLFSAVLSADLRVERGPTRISIGHTLRYAAAPGADERLWVVWLGGVVSEPSLYLQSLDSEGRPQLPSRLALNVVDFALASGADRSIYVFWIDAGEGGVYLAHLQDGQTLETRRLTSGVSLSRGDMLEGLRAGMDETHGYLFWNISRAAGTGEVWLTSGVLNGEAWTPPRRWSAANGEAVSYAAPLAVQRTPLPVAVQSASGLWLTLVQGGAALTQTPLALGARLVAPPSLTADGDQGLYAAWADAMSADRADLVVQRVE
jgi:hypothetical protein